MFWDTWKKGFDVWEQRTAEFTEQLLKSPLMLEPAGLMLSTAMKLKAASDQAVAAWWASVGLPTRRDQERTLHALNQLQSRIIDLEERLAESQRHNVN
jgi:hypothetical protein